MQQLNINNLPNLSLDDQFNLVRSTLRGLRSELTAKNTPSPAKKLGEKVAKDLEARLKIYDERRRVEALTQDLTQRQDALSVPNTAEYSVAQLIAQRREIRTAMRRLSTDPNNAATVHQLGEVYDATLRDLEKFSGDFGSPSASIDANGQFTFLDDFVEDGLSLATDDRLEPLRKANAFTRSLHDIFTRTFAGEVRKRDSRGAFKIEPTLLYENLMRGTGSRIALRMDQLAESVNWLYSPKMQGFVEELNEEALSELNANRLNTLLGAEQDILSFFARETVNLETGLVDPVKANSFIRRYERALGPLFGALFEDLKDARKASLLVKDITAENKEQTKRFMEQTALMQFLGVEDSPGRIIQRIVGEPGNRPVNARQSLIKLINDLKDAPPEAKEGLKDIILDQAWVYAGGANSDKDFNFERFRDYLFSPLSGKDGPSIANLFQHNGLMSVDQFNDYRIMLNQANRVEQVMKTVGPEFTGELVDKGFILQNMVARIVGSGLATGGLEKLKKLAPGLFGSSGAGNIVVASEGAKAARAIFEQQPNALIRDIFIEAFKDPKLLRELLERASNKKTQYRKLKILPTFLAPAGIELVSGDEPIEIPVQDPFSVLNEARSSYEGETKPSLREPQIPFSEEQRSLEEQPKAPLSIRNNNPGNLREAGQPGVVGTDSGFAVFQSPQAGLQAMRRQIALDTQERGMTLSQFLTKYAPPSENDTFGYIDFVSRVTGLDPDRRVPPEKISDVMRAMVQMEGGPEAVSYYFGGTQDRPRPTAKIELPPLPTPQATPAPASPNPQSRQQYAAMFPNESVSQMIKGGIGSLA